MLLLGDGSVLGHQEPTRPTFWRLVPDSTGSYVNGTWSPIAVMPTINGVAYKPDYYASGLLPDGRMMIEGGEYNVNTRGMDKRGARSTIRSRIRGRR